MNKIECEFCGKKKTIEELGTVSCKECEEGFDNKISKWYLLALGISLIILLGKYEIQTVSVILGIAFGIMITLLLRGTKND